MDGAVHRIPRKPLSNVLQYDNVSREGVAPLFSVSEGRLHLCDLKHWCCLVTHLLGHTRDTARAATRELYGNTGVTFAKIKAVKK